MIAGYSKILIGLKSDLIREVSIQDAQKLAIKLGNIPYYETSAKNNENIDNSMLHIIKDTLEFKQKLELEANKLNSNNSSEISSNCICF